MRGSSRVPTREQAARRRGSGPVEPPGRVRLCPIGVIQTLATMPTVLREHRFVAAAALYAVAVIIADICLGSAHGVSGLLVVVPIVVAYERRWKWAAMSALLSAVVIATNLFGRSRVPLDDLLVRLGGVTLAAAFGIYAAIDLAAREHSLAHTKAAAEAAQRAILPVVPEQLGPYRFATLYRSSAEESLVGGDFYKVIRSPWGTRLIIGDVEGKGLGAVSMSSLVLGCFREWAPRTPTLDDLVQVLDQRVLDYEERSAFVTAVVGNLGPDLMLELAVCGHQHPLLSRDRRWSTLAPERCSTPLGLGAKPTVQRVHLQPGDRLLLYTDGLTETRSADGRWVALEDVVATYGSDPLATALDTVAARLTERGKLLDDLAMLLIEVAPDAQAGSPTSWEDSRLWGGSLQ